MSGCDEPLPAEWKIYFFFALGGFWEDRWQEFVEMCLFVIVWNMVFMDGETSRIFSNLILLRQWLMDRIVSFTLVPCYLSFLDCSIFYIDRGNALLEEYFSHRPAIERDQFFQSCLVAQIMAISIEDGYILKLWKPHLYMSCHCFLSPSHVRPVQAPQV